MENRKVLTGSIESQPKGFEFSGLVQRYEDYNRKRNTDSSLKPPGQIAAELAKLKYTEAGKTMLRGFTEFFKSLPHTTELADELALDLTLLVNAFISFDREVDNLDSAEAIEDLLTLHMQKLPTLDFMVRLKKYAPNPAAYQCITQIYEQYVINTARHAEYFLGTGQSVRIPGSQPEVIQFQSQVQVTGVYLVVTAIIMAGAAPNSSLITFLTAWVCSDLETATRTLDDLLDELEVDDIDFPKTWRQYSQAIRIFRKLELRLQCEQVRLARHNQSEALFFQKSAKLIQDVGFFYRDFILRHFNRLQADWELPDSH